MTINELKVCFFNHPLVSDVNTSIKQGIKTIHISGLCGSGESFLLSTVLHQNEKFILAVFSNKEEAAYYFNDLENLCTKGKVFFFPTSYRTPYEQTENTDNANILHRAEVLSAINLKQSGIIVTYPESLSEKVVTKKHLKQNTLELSLGEKINTDFINEVLHEYHFERVDFVAEPGQFSIRGGIIDIFSFSGENPYRIELFDDSVESIRSFDAGTQLSVQKLSKIVILPNIEGNLLKESRESFFEYLSGKEILFWMKNYELCCDKLSAEFEKAKTNFEKIDSPVNHIPPHELYTGKQDLDNFISTVPVVETGSRSYFKPQSIIAFHQLPQPPFRKNFELLFSNFYENKKNKLINIIAASSAKQIERLYKIFEDIPDPTGISELNRKTESEINETTETHSSPFTPVMLSLHEGFIDTHINIACYTDHQIFERYHRFRLKEGYQQARQALSLKELTDLQKGDFVTHIDYGIGKFDGLEVIDVNGKPQETIRLIYKDNDILYVSIHSLHRIARYSGKDGTIPKINKLGTNTWQTLKQKTKKKVKEIAYDLIKLYAQRKAQNGFAFSPDTYLQNELEASFIYEDTPDQLKATQDVKQDMEVPHPMDRLICGDVGFGKTEIAIRAAFKAATDGKQVTVLAPTTILTLQHYHTFSDRLKEFPCNIDYINRFKTSKQIKETLKKLEKGEIDILIGTHRAVSADVKFKDLGLLIIDEEQKFGVSVKDKLKLLKTNVDTLTLTATPIPRTLQFSLMGARDLSVINTPPPNRYPVQTEVHTFNEELIRDVIFYEVSRNGQVFFVHNRVQNIKEVAGMIQRLCPDIKIAVGHGQMKGHELEEIMSGFIEGEYDVLVSTSIVESGLDISNANTIIINNAHMFGLSDLHQLRGRVGRSNKKAFCYLLSPPLSVLPSESQKRLRAIEQFSELGSGFSIAMRDMDIRGAGNLLGGEQSGFISEIGYETYQKILQEAIQELKENEFKELFAENQPVNEEKRIYSSDCQIETDFEVMIPLSYVNNVSERLSLYQDLSNCETEEQLTEFENQLTDRFGPVPEPCKELINTIRLRWLGKHLGFEKIVIKSNKMVCYFISSPESDYFHSPTFNKILLQLQKNQQLGQMKEKNAKLTLLISNINSIEKAFHSLQLLVSEIAYSH